MSAETYEGKPCARDGSTTRYRSNRKCVKCSRLEVRYFAPAKADEGYEQFESAQAAREGTHYPDDIWRATPLK